jgi:hypothetical protein
MNIESNTALIKTMTCRPIRAGDLADVVIIEKAATEFPWSLKNFQGCLKAGYKAWVFSNETGEVVGFAKCLCKETVSRGRHWSFHLKFYY